MSPSAPTAGSISRNSRFASALRPGITAAKRIDSGNERASNAASSKGRTPPTTNMARQPNGATSCAVAMPAPMAPSEMPLPTNITISARRLCGAYSEASPIAFGNAAPSPRPVKNRSAVKGPQRIDGRRQQRQHAEGDARVDDDFAPPDSIGERREKHCAEHDANEAAGEGRPQLAANQTPFLRDRRRDVGDALHVEPVDEQHRRA